MFSSAVGCVLYYSHITDQGVAHLCDALKDGNCKLTKLSLGYNHTTDQGVAHLCDALKDGNCKLTKLSLGYNQITDQGVANLCVALKDWGHLGLGQTRQKLWDRYNAAAKKRIFNYILIFPCGF